MAEENAIVREIDKIRLRRWRKRGFYSENALVKLLKKNGYNAVRVPVSNPSLNPLPDIMARKGSHSFAFEVKNASYYAYFPKQQIDKLFRFLNELVPQTRSTNTRSSRRTLAKNGSSRKSFGLTGRRTSFLKRSESSSATEETLI